jgi:hypothetical protein
LVTCSGYQCGDLSGDGSSVWWGIKTTVVGSTTLVDELPAFQIRWKSEDLEYLPHHPLSALATITSNSATASETGDSTGTQRSNTSGPSATGSEPSETAAAAAGGLGTGAIAGIAVGAVAGVALLGGLLWFLLRRRNKHQPEPVQQSDPSMVQYVGSPPPGSVASPPQQQQQQFYPQQYQQQQYPQQYPQQYQPYVPPGAVTSYYDKTGAGEPQHHPAYPHQQPSPSLQSTPPVQTAYQPPPQPYAQPHPPGLVLGSDLEVVSSSGGTPSVDHRSSTVAGQEEWERQQLLQRQHDLQQQQARWEIEQIQREQQSISHRLSQMPPPR